MGEQRIIQQADGWHFKIRGGNTVGPFADRAAAELAVSNYARRWRQRINAAPGRWRNWRRTPTPLATGTVVPAGDGGSESPIAIESNAVMRPVR